MPDAAGVTVKAEKICRDARRVPAVLLRESRAIS
jgi:hypothetical protein